MKKLMTLDLYFYIIFGFLTTATMILFFIYNDIIFLALEIGFAGCFWFIFINCLYLHKFFKEEKEK